MEGKLHEAVQRIETIQGCLLKKVQSLLIECRELAEDLGEEVWCDVDGCSLTVKAVRLEDYKQALEAKKAECLAELNKKQLQWLAMASNEGIELQFNPRLTIKKAKLEMEQVEQEWPIMLQQAQTEREQLHQACKQLCLLLKGDEQPFFDGLFLGSGKQVKERLLNIHQNLQAKVQCRSEALRECQQVFNDLSIDSIVIDFNDLSESNVSRLTGMKLQTIKEHRERIINLYSESIIILKDLLDCLCLAVPDEYLINNTSTIDTAALMQIVKRIKQDIEGVQQRAERARSIKTVLDERKSLIAQMLIFEKTASDPARLFAPSFRLLQEEKFRRSAVPTLKRLECKLLKELMDYEALEGCEYTLPDGGGQRVSLRESLEKEISERFVNEAVFGFHPDSKSMSPKTPQRIRKENINGNSYK